MEPQSKAARLRDVLPAIEQKVAEGVRIADIVRTLNGAGLELTEGTLKSYLSRHRKRKAEVPHPPSQPGGRPVDATIPREALSLNPAGKSQPMASDAGVATMPARASGAGSGPPSPAQPDAASAVPAAASPQPASPAPSAAIGIAGAHTARSESTADADADADDQAMPLHGSGSVLSVHEALVAARRRVAATDYSKFARKPTRKAK